MKVAIVGAGAVGGLAGGLLARAGHAVSFVAHGATLDALRSAGLTIELPGETLVTGPVQASADPADLGRQAMVIVAVKAWQVEPLAPSLAPLVGEDTLVVPVQNGVEAALHLGKALGERAVVGGLCHVLATRSGPARLRTVGPPIHFTVGERGGDSARAVDATRPAESEGTRLARLAADLRAAGMGVTVSSDIESALFAKLLFVEPFGSVGAVSRSPVEVVREFPETRALLVAAMLEVRAVAERRGVHMPSSVVETSLARIDSLPEGATASMHKDLAEGRASELNEQTGAVVRLAREGGVPSPVHDFLWASLLPQDPRLRSLRKV